MNLKGKWVGQYTYGLDYEETLKGKSVNFELELETNGVEFKGFFIDEETNQIFKEPGFIENGFLENTSITFTKRYPCFWITDESGEIKLFPDEPSHSIYYSGVLIEDAFQGEWEILSFLVDENGPYTEVNGTGTWFMKKKSINKKFAQQRHLTPAGQDIVTFTSIYTSTAVNGRRQVLTRHGILLRS